MFRNTMNDVNSQLSSIVGGIAEGSPSRLADLGITFIETF
jgi:hypothetical protein